MCLGKKQYDSNKDAYTAAVLLGQRPYECPYCLKWHLSTKGVTRKYRGPSS